MAKKPLTDEEVVELFSELDESGVVDLERKAARESGGKRGPRARRRKVDPLSEDDPSGSRAGEAIGRTAVAVILGVFVFIVGMQVVYGVSRRLNTANLSEGASVDSVRHAMESGVEWGNGFTQFPEQFTVDEVDERAGVIEVSVVDTTSGNELELLSNSQIQAAALATNALLNSKIDRVVYNVYVLVDENGNFQHDSFLGLLKARGTRKAMLSFVWNKNDSDGSSNVDWELKIIGMDEGVATKIQKQVNSVSSLIEDDTVSQDRYDDGVLEAETEQAQHGEEVLTGK